VFDLLWTRPLVCALLVACALLHAQTTAEPAPRDSAPTFSFGVNLVLVPVVVRDAKGHAAGDLHKEDFELFDKGKPQFISAFSVEHPGTAAIIPDRAVETDADGHVLVKAEHAGELPAPPVATHFVAWLFDDVHLTFSDLARARDAADRVLASLEPGARAGIFTTSGRITLDFTDDSALLRKTLPRIRSSLTMAGGMHGCPDIGYYQATRIDQDDPLALHVAVSEYAACSHTPSKRTQSEQIVRAYASQASSVGDHNTRLALGMLKAVTQRMSWLPGSRTILMVSPGFYLTADHRLGETDLMDRVARANVVINSFDALGLFAVVPGGDAGRPAGFSGAKPHMELEIASANTDVMAELALATGGTFVHNDNDFGEGFARLAAQPESIYVLGFSPASVDVESFHTLNVKLTMDARRTRGGYQLQSRRGYFVPRRTTGPAEQANREMQEALFSRDAVHNLPIELRTQFFRTKDDKTRLVILARVDARHLRYRTADGRNYNTLTVAGAVFDPNGNYITGTRKAVEMKLKDQTLETMPESGVTFETRMDIAPGSYVIRVVVRDSEDQAMSAQNSMVQIP
jgi:VWFA-related protein